MWSVAVIVDSTSLDSEQHLLRLNPAKISLSYCKEGRCSSNYRVDSGIHVGVGGYAAFGISSHMC
jgi:hypothetical protein